MRVLKNIIISLIVTSSFLYASFNIDNVDPANPSFYAEFKTDNGSCTYVIIQNKVVVEEKSGQTDAECATMQNIVESAQKTVDAKVAAYDSTNDTDSLNNPAAATANTASTTSTMAPSIAKPKTTATGGCGFNQNFFNSTGTANIAMNFDTIVLRNGLDNITQDQFEAKIQNLDKFSGFVCPSIKELKENNINKEEKHTVSISDIDFSTGEYTCAYTFLKSNAPVYVNLVNKSCNKDMAVINEKSQDVASLPEYQYIKGFGNIDFEQTGMAENGDFATESLYPTKAFKKSYEKIVQSLDVLSDTYKSAETTVDIGGSINSHTNHSKTMSSIVVGILTADEEFFDSKIITNDGALSLHGASVLDTLSPNGKNEVVNMASNMVQLIDSMDTKFWGFYYYLIYNVSNAFASIITMIFSLGTISVFGFAYAKKLTEDDRDSSSQFNWKNKFIGVFAVFTMFTAPIIPNVKSLPSNYVYAPSSNSVAQSNEKYSEVRRDSTAIQVALRYMFQLGTYWANQVNDYALFSYLTYISSAVGHFDSSTMLSSYKQDVSSFIQQSALLKKEVDFFEATCGYNYFSTLKTKSDLPNFTDGYGFELSALSTNQLGIQSVSYPFCSDLFHSIKLKTGDILVDYQKMLKAQERASESMNNINANDIKNVNNFLQYTIAINNKFGWISIAMIPSLQGAMEAKRVVGVIDSYKSENEEIFSSFGNTHLKQIDLIKKSDELMPGERDMQSQAGFFNTLSTFFGKAKNILGSWAGNTIGRGLKSVGDVISLSLGWIGGKTIYFMFPGFGDMYKAVQESQIPYYIVENGMSGLEHAASIVPVGGVVIKGLELIKGIKNVVKSKVSKNTNGESRPATLFSAILVFIVAYLIAVFLYTFVITTLSLALVSALIIIKIIYFFIEIIVVMFISMAVMLWALTMDKQRTVSTISEFFYKVSILALSPISIVLSVYVFIFAKGTMYWLYRLINEMIYAIVAVADNSMSTTGITNIGGLFTFINTYAAYNMGEMILIFMSLFLAYNIIFHFHDWILDYFGHKGGSSAVSKSADSVFQEIKSRTVSKV